MAILLERQPCNSNTKRLKWLIIFALSKLWLQQKLVGTIRWLIQCCSINALSLKPVPLASSPSSFVLTLSLRNTTLKMRANVKVAAIATVLLCLAAHASAVRTTLNMYDMASRHLLVTTADTCTAFTATFSGTPADATVNGCKASDVKSTNPTAYVAFSSAPASPTPCNYPVDVGAPSDSELTGLTATTCNHFTRTWTATNCLPLSSNTASTTYTLNPSGLPSITVDASQSATFTCKGAASLPTPTTSDVATGSAKDSCGNSITTTPSIGAYTKTPSKCQATATVTYTASDCAGQAAPQQTATLTLTASDSPSVSVTAPSTDLSIVQPTCNQPTTLTSSNSVITTWLRGSSYSCDCTATIGGSCSSSTTFQQVGGTSGAFTSVTVPSVTTKTKVGTFTFSASNDCASNSATKDLYICPCQVTNCPIGFYSKGYWGTCSRTCATGSTCNSLVGGSATASTCPLPSELQGLCTPTYNTPCACAGANSALDNSIEQLTTLWMNANCASSSTAAAASQFVTSKIAALEGCSYISNCFSSSTISLDDIYSCSKDQQKTDAAGVAKCIGTGLVNYIDKPLPGTTSNTNCLALLSNTGGC